MDGFPSADAALRWYVRENASCGLPRPGNVVQAEGLVFEKRCPSCGGKSRKLNETATLWICADHHCRAPWPLKEAYLLAGEVQQAPRNNARDSRLSECASLGLIFMRLEDSRAHGPGFRLLKMQVLRGFSYDECARSGRRNGRGNHRHQLTRDRARSMIQAARRELERRLFNAGLMG